MNAKPLYQQWLERSRSNLERARMEKHSRLIKYEDMCFDCQQSVEKALKALLVFENITFEWTHHIGNLIKNLEDGGVIVPLAIKKSATLTVYAVRTRYPGEDDPVTKKEFKEALTIAELVYRWVKDGLKPKVASTPSS